MTQELRELANEWIERECDEDDIRCDGGSTSTNKLMRAYIAAASPAAILALLDRLEKAEKDAERYRWLRGRFRASWLNNHIPPIRGHELVEAPAVIYIDLPRRTRASGLPSKYEVDPARIDTAIDSAMEASK